MNRTRHNLLFAYTALLITAILWPLAFPGFLGLRDMVVLDSPALSISNFGVGDIPARNAPQDGFLAIIGTVFPASWFVRALLLACACFAAYSASACARNGSFWHKAAAITLILWNPFVIERFLQGHWSLVIAAWLLPGIAIATSTRVKLALLAACSITPTGLVLGFITAAWTARKSIRTQCALLLGTAALSIPWLIPSLQNPPSSFGTTAFVARAESYVGTVGSLLGLGGMWNAQAVPTSRSAGFAIAGVLLFFLLVSFMPRREALLGFTGLALCLLLTFGPTEWIVNTIPGASLFRDSQKLMALMLPAMVLAAGRIQTSAIKNQVVLPALVIFLSILQVPDAPYAMSALKPHAHQGPWKEYPGTTLNTDSRGLIEYNGTIMVDPWSKATNLVASGELTVDSAVVDPASTRYVEAVDAWDRGDTHFLSHQGITGVISESQYHSIAPATQGKPSQWWIGLGLTIWWMIVSVLLILLGLHSRFRSSQMAK